MIAATILQTIMNGALAQIWGMINGLQLLMHLPTLNLSFPEVAFVVVEKLLLVFTFDIPNVDFRLFGENVQPPVDDKILTDIDDARITQVQ